MELGFLDTNSETGLLIREHSSEWIEWDGGIAGGMEPIWLFPTKSATIAIDDMTLCKICKKQLVFLTQIYCPLDDILNAFHRDLCLFACLHCEKSVTCIRTQLAQKNKYYPFNCAQDDEGDMYCFIFLL